MPWLAFLLALILSYLLTPLVGEAGDGRFGAVAVPRERDVHKKPLPRWGGLAMFGAFLRDAGPHLPLHRHAPARLPLDGAEAGTTSYGSNTGGPPWLPWSGRWTTSSRSGRPSSRSH